LECGRIIVAAADNRYDIGLLPVRRSAARQAPMILSLDIVAQWQNQSDFFGNAVRRFGASSTSLEEHPMAEAVDPIKRLEAMKNMAASCKQSAERVAGAKKLLADLNKAESAAKTAKKELEGEADEGEE
jgi:hypothetical protein